MSKDRKEWVKLKTRIQSILQKPNTAISIEERHALVTLLNIIHMNLGAENG